MLQLTSALLALSLLHSGRAAPSPFNQIPLQLSDLGNDARQAVAQEKLLQEGPDGHEWNVLHHLAGISPYFNSHGADPDAPEGCTVVTAAILARHSSITMNDDEFPDTIEPFLEQFDSYDRSRIPEKGVFAFLRDWETPVTEDNMEEMTEPGGRDAESFGQRLAERYSTLMPEDHNEAFRIYSAGSPRDVDSAHAFIHGIFPNRTIGNETGQIELVKVPNKAEDWKTSLTPHKTCPRYDKTVGKKEREHWQKIYTKSVIKRMKKELPGWEWKFTDVVAMQQLCGYETAIRGSSEFCSVFTPKEFEAFEYGEDLYYFNQLGRNVKWTAALGIPWLQIAANRLNETRRSFSAPSTIVKPTPTSPIDLFDDEHPLPLPKPTGGPNETLAQPLHIWFTHREEIPFVTHALDLFHGHSKLSKAMPLNKINKDRIFKTSEILPFLGHVILERLQCSSASSALEGDVDSEAYVRILVNGSPKTQPSCNSGPGQSCPLDQFIDLVGQLPGLYGNLDKVCQEGAGHGKGGKDKKKNKGKKGKKQ